MTSPSSHGSADLLSSLNQKALLGLAADQNAHHQPRAYRLPSIEELSDLFPELEIEELLGTGGMGCVFRARQKKLDRVVAIKILPRELASDDLFAERFAREARAMARLNHPNIVSIYDFGQAGDMYYLSMEYMDGMNLRELIDAKALDPHEAMGVFAQVCNALSYAHAEGVIHRDIKPENILFNKQGHVALADFGLARLAMDTNAEISITQTRQAMGTLNYMAPEQYENPKTVDHRADIYALGVLLYELMTGKVPRGSFPSVESICPTGPKVDHMINQALQVAPDDRYASVESMLNDQPKSDLLNGGFAANGTFTNFVNLGAAPFRLVGKLAGRVGSESPPPPTKPQWLSLYKVTLAAIGFTFVLQMFTWDLSSDYSRPAYFQEGRFGGPPYFLIFPLLFTLALLAKYRNKLHPFRWLAMVTMCFFGVFAILACTYDPSLPAVVFGFAMGFLALEFACVGFPRLLRFWGWIKPQR